MSSAYGQEAGYRMPLLAKVHDHAFARDVDEARVKRCLMSAPGAMLELICGGGRALKYAIDCGRPAIGIDFSPDMIEVARGKYSQEISNGTVKLLCGEYTKMKLPEGLSLVTSLMNSWPLVVDPADRKKLIGGIKNSLVPGGRLLIDMSNNLHNTEEKTYVIENDISGLGHVVVKVEWARVDSSHENKTRDVRITIRVEEEVEEHVFKTGVVDINSLLHDLADEGFGEVVVSGDYDGSKFTQASPYCLIEAVKE